MHASVTKGAAAKPSNSQASQSSNADFAAALQNSPAVASHGNGIDPSKSAGIVDGAPSGNFFNSGNGAVVITPAAGGQSGGAIVQLPVQAKNDTPPGHLGQDLPVTLPTGPSAVVPEPSSIALMLAGVLGAAGVARRRKR
jgi:hypothetical protein